MGMSRIAQVDILSNRRSKMIAPKLTVSDGIIKLTCGMMEHMTLVIQVQDSRRLTGFCLMDGTRFYGMSQMPAATTEHVAIRST